MTHSRLEVLESKDTPSARPEPSPMRSSYVERPKAADTQDLATGPQTRTGEDWIEPILSRMSAVESQLEGFVRAKPVPILLGALALGFIASRVLASKDENH